MTPPTSLEIKGNLITHCAAELVSEVTRGELTGSLRLENKELKSILYFTAGRLSYAVSNARKARLFDILLSGRRLEKEALAAIPNFTNDHELSAYLQSHQLLTKAELDALSRAQVDGVLIDVFGWIDGSWSFSPLARVRDGLDFKIDVRPTLLQYGRCLPGGLALKRARIDGDSFIRTTGSRDGITLLSVEEKLLGVLSDSPSALAGFIASVPVSEAEIAKSVYACWLAGLVDRTDWHPAFSSSAVRAMNTAHLELKREAIRVEVSKPEPAAVPEETIREVSVTDIADEVVPIGVYLARVEKADTFYDVLGIDSKADHGSVKAAYLSLAKQFHPDRFHKETGPHVPRVQAAFAELSKAYETLKTPESRELYDYRVRKELAEKDRVKASGVDQSVDQRLQQARSSFEQGQALFNEGEIDRAIPFFARAAHFDSKNARYRAEYGRVLSSDANQKHKAEAELQAAIGLAPDQPSYRLMLAQFFIDKGLLKRAEGELGRMLKAFPQNREALALLETLR